MSTPSSSSTPLTEETTTTTVSTTNERKGYAHVKKEYLVIETVESTTTTTTLEKKRPLEDETTDEPASKAQKNNEGKKKKRGQNKGRTKANQTSFLKSSENNNNKSSDNGDAVDEDEQKVVKQQGEKNRLGIDILRSLRKKEYDFTKANEVIKHVEDYVKMDVKRQDRLNNNQFQMFKLRARQIEIAEQNALKNGTQPETTLEQFYNSIPSEEDRRLLRLTYVETKHKPKEVKKIDFRGKTTLAPLTTVGNLPFRRICKGFGVDVTCGEMAMATNIIKGQAGELSLLRRHESEDIFGVQLAGNNADTLCKVAQLIEDQLPDIDFVEINCGCPIDLLCNQGMGSGLLEKKAKLQGVVRGMKEILSIPLCVKTRTGIKDNKLFAHTLFPQVKEWGVDVLTLHGRTRQQRYTKEADWNYIARCASLVRDDNLQVIGNGDTLSFEEFNDHIKQVDAVMIGRGALIKPWVFTEIKEQRHWDITANERLEMLKDFVKFGYDHYGSDEYGIATTRRYLLEWLSFLHRYIPVGLLERVPQRINERPPKYFGRNDLETLMASGSVQDWIKISNMIMPPPDASFTFIPKHKSNSYEG